ncbi:MAG TPA: DUF3068 domain-containing protein [Nocardioides sp.]|nr:DUF3068 domain-containing protein [Nocardioides sp.]
MRSKIASVLVGLGVFLIVAAVLVRAYAYPTLARVPTNYDETTKLEAKGALVFNSDPKVLKTETSDLDISAHTVADSGAKAPDGKVVWVTSTTLKRPDGSVFQQQRDRVPFDAVSGKAVDCAKCDSWSEVATGVQVPVVRKGQTLKFPFDTQKKDYLVWDDATGQATTARYEGTAKVDGLTAYKFVQTIKPQIIETREVPGSVFGVEKASVLADMWYGMTRTFYIEPNTGSPVNRVEERQQELRYDGVVVPAFTGTVKYTAAQVQKSVNDTKSKGAMLGGMKVLYPLVMFLLGLAMVALGLVMNRGGRKVRNDVDAEDKSLVGV